MNQEIGSLAASCSFIFGGLSFLAMVFTFPLLPYLLWYFLFIPLFLFFSFSYYLQCWFFNCFVLFHSKLSCSHIVPFLSYIAIPLLLAYNYSYCTLVLCTMPLKRTTVSGGNVWQKSLFSARRIIEYPVWGHRILCATFVRANTSYTAIIYCQLHYPVILRFSH